MEKEQKKSLKIYVTVEPLGVKMIGLFSPEDKVYKIAQFVQNKTRQMGVKYNIGRVTEKKSGAVIFADYSLGDILKNEDEVIIYNNELGLADLKSGKCPGGWVNAIANFYRTGKLLQKKTKRDEQKEKKKDEKKDEESENKKEKTPIKKDKKISSDERKEKKKQSPKKDKKNDKNEKTKSNKKQEDEKSVKSDDESNSDKNSSSENKDNNKSKYLDSDSDN